MCACVFCKRTQESSCVFSAAAATAAAGRVEPTLTACLMEREEVSAGGLTGQQHSTMQQPSFPCGAFVQTLSKPTAKGLWLVCWDEGGESGPE